MTTEKQQNRADRDFNKPTDKTKGGGKDQMQQSGKQQDQMGSDKHKQPGQADKTVQPDAGVSRSSTR